MGFWEKSLGHQIKQITCSAAGAVFSTRGAGRRTFWLGHQPAWTTTCPGAGQGSPRASLPLALGAGGLFTAREEEMKGRGGTSYPLFINAVELCFFPVL